MMDNSSWRAARKSNIPSKYKHEEIVASSGGIKCLIDIHKVSSSQMSYQSSPKLSMNRTIHGHTLIQMMVRKYNDIMKSENHRAQCCKWLQMCTSMWLDNTCIGIKYVS